MIDQRMNKVAQSPVRIRFIRVASFGVLFTIGAFLIWADPFGCSASCSRTVQSEQAARDAVAAFFSSGSGHSKLLIADLRRDGMTDEYLANLKAGCPECYVFRGEPERNQDSNAWYAMAGIAPAGEKKTIRLLVECANAVSLDERLYGG
jgi:hypothetical protein